jgi:hypothetical protein
MKTFTKSILALALLSVGGIACDGTGADPAVSNPAQEDVLVPGDVTPFLGVWAYASGSITSTCGSSRSTKELSAADGTVEFTTGEGPGTLAVRDGACAFSATVSGSSAVADPGVSCEGFVGTPSIVYSVAGRTMQKRATATVSAGKFGVVCSTNEDAVLSVR